MILMELTPEEGRDLAEEINKRLSELDHEIGHTDSMEFKAMLKRRRETVRKFLEKLQGSVAAAA